MNYKDRIKLMHKIYFESKHRIQMSQNVMIQISQHYTKLNIKPYERCGWKIFELDIVGQLGVTRPGFLGGSAQHLKYFGNLVQI